MPGGPDVPGIELYDRRLTAPEIYAQRFHASLVSLSACETGKGHLAGGEGVLSLARAFAYAGAQSLVSHWKVNERSTAELFSVFYKNVQQGIPKVEALRQSKLNYLASAEIEIPESAVLLGRFYPDWRQWLGVVTLKTTNG